MQVTVRFCWTILVTSTLCLFFSNCKESTKENPTLNGMETAQQFIRLEMAGNYEEAEALLFQEEKNLSNFDSLRTQYALLSKDKKNELKKMPPFQIQSIEDLSDSTIMMKHIDPVLKKEITLQLCRKSGKWFILLPPIKS